ncbi:STAS domain-containing protein [Streptomyces sp. NPDC006487]|uniref:STAS domain-containing protein n=1 Tax=Streptomyces sp. NPDC006487 TaxID=3364748 RepID=UPI0036CC1C36
MTFAPPNPLRLTYLDTDDTVRIELHGDFDYERADDLLNAVRQILADRTGLKELHLHCGNVTAVDSTGLSTLLMIRRHTDTAEVHLRIVDRPICLERILELTGTLNHLTAGHTGQRASSRPIQEENAAADGNTWSEPLSISAPE